MTTEHTPTPEKDCDLQNLVADIIDDAIKSVHALGLTEDRFSSWQAAERICALKTAEDGAAFIVRAVNAFDAMREALEAAEKALVNHANSGNMAWVSPLLATMKSALRLGQR